MIRCWRVRAVATRLSLALGVSFLSSQLLAADGVDQRLVPRVESAMRNCSESVYSGSFRLRQRMEGVQNENRIEAVTKKEPLASCVFDFANDRFRFERTFEFDKLVHIDSPNGSVGYSRQGNVVAKYAPGRSAAGNELLGALDVRLIGFANRTELLRYDKGNYQRLFELLSSTTLVDVLETEGGDLRTTWRYGNDNEVRRTIVFSVSQDYRPTTMSESYAPAGYAAKVLTTCTVGWTNIGGSVVPLECRFEEAEGRIELEFDWVSVNTPLDDKEFTVEGMDLPDGTLVANYALGESKSFVEGRIGDSEESTPTIPRTSTWRRSVLWVNLVALPLLFIAYLAVKRWRNIA